MSKNTESYKIEAVYNSCVKFVKWYDQNKESERKKEELRSFYTDIVLFTFLLIFIIVMLNFLFWDYIYF